MKESTGEGLVLAKVRVAATGENVIVAGEQLPVVHEDVADLVLLQRHVEPGNRALREAAQTLRVLQFLLLLRRELSERVLHILINAIKAESLLSIDLISKYVASDIKICKLTSVKNEGVNLEASDRPGPRRSAGISRWSECPGQQVQKPPGWNVRIPLFLDRTVSLQQASLPHSRLARRQRSDHRVSLACRIPSVGERWSCSAVNKWVHT